MKWSPSKVHGHPEVYFSDVVSIEMKGAK